MKLLAGTGTHYGRRWKKGIQVATGPPHRYNNCNCGAATSRYYRHRLGCRRRPTDATTRHGKGARCQNGGWSIHTVSTRSDSEREPLRLDQFLKLRGIADTGGQAKLLIQSGEVQVNGEVETRRRRKLVVGDVVKVGGIAYSPDEFLSGS